MAKLSKERLEYLSNELKKYKADLDINKKSLTLLEEKISGLISSFSDKGYTVAYITSRLKTEESFIRKQNKNKDKGLDIDYENMHDIIGIRLVCLTKTDINAFIDELKSSNEFKIVEERDYINEPKASGYKSYHILVEYPVSVGTEIRYVTAEIQLRTILMDIFAREEHKISYKGECQEEDKIKLRKLSKKLAFYDWALDTSFKVDNKVDSEVDNDLSTYITEYEKVSYIFGKVYDEIKPIIEESIGEYKNKDDVLHFVHGIKPIKSIKRKMVKRKLECTAENMLYNLRDIVRYKVVCTDEKTATEYINVLKNKLIENERINIIEESGFDDKKESGYRGYKINASYSMPFVTGNPIVFEILIRTMAMDAWALHNDKIYNNKEAQEEYGEAFQGLSESLHDAEILLEKMKDRNKAVKKEDNILKLVKNYEKESK